jgi:hypothetical protein
MPKLVFTTNDLREFQPDLAAQLEKEVSDGAADEPADTAMECRILERHAERPQIAVHIEAKDWVVSFSITTPAAAGELKMATKRALRDRGRRGPYQRSTRR